MTKELCIMPKHYNYKTERFTGSERHEVFGAANRNKSIKYGLVIFITPEQHRGTGGIHHNPKEWEWLKQIGQKAYMEHYNKTEDEFRKEFGKNYL